MTTRRGPRPWGLHIESIMHDVSVLHDILFALDVHTAGLLDGRLGAVLNKVVVLDHLRADESLLKVCMDHARALG